MSIYSTVNTNGGSVKAQISTSKQSNHSGKLSEKKGLKMQVLTSRRVISVRRPPNIWL